ncbi:MAG: TlpA disulfide reductase family protein [Lachnospiraceae bacterium]|nr:TlpA disulfide reductase family protein [Lachnospiraceae bacterium]
MRKYNRKKLNAVLLTGVLLAAVPGITASAETAGTGQTLSGKQEAPLTVVQTESEKQENAAPEEGASEKASLGEFTTQDIYGNTCTQDIFKDYDLTLVNIFATWCPPCVAEIPDLEKLCNDMADKNVHVVGIVLDAIDGNGEIVQDSVEKAKLLAEKTGASYPFLLPDSTYLNGRLTDIYAVPETFFVDKDGNIVGDTYSGSNSYEGWTKTVEEELSRLQEND